jgi:signal transduction histidine kinase/CheY-like chemotaxis protein
MEAAPYRRWPLLAAFGLAACALVASALVMVHSMRAEALRKADAQLEAVGALKVDAVTAWIDDRVVAARYACTYPSAIQAAMARLSGPVQPSLAAHVRQILAHFAERWGYALVGLLDGSGRPIALAGADATAARVPDRWFLEAALADPRRAARRLSIAGDGTGTLEVAVVTPIGEAAIAFCVLRVDAKPLIDDIIETWPVPSDTGSVALLRTMGTEAVLLLPLRERTGPDFSRMPLAQRHRPAVQAALGERGLIEGTNRQGVPILIKATPIPGTEWSLRTRMNRDEVMAPLRRPSATILGLVGAFLVAGVLLLGRWWKEDGRRAAVEEALRRSRERLELAVAGTHAVWDWDVDAGRMTMEGELAHALGLPPVGLRGDVRAIVAGYVHPDDRKQEVAAILSHLRRETRLYESEHRVLAADGLHWVRMRGQVVARDDAGRPLRMAGVASDVTERRRLQAKLELSQRMAGLGRLAAGVAHEINNPLSSVVANLAWVEEELGGGREELRKALGEARDSAERVRDVVRGLRTFSMPTAAQRGPVDVRGELEAALRLAAHELRHRAALDVRIEPLPPVVADAHELGQVFLNLIVNAAQSIPEGRAAEQRVTVDARTDARGWAAVEIRDTGVGIAPDVLDRIFEPFFTTKPLGVGTGLGLAIAHGIVTAAGGRIEVESRLGEGSTFRVLLPPAPESQPAPPPPAPEERKVPPPREPGHGRILLVDDEPLVARAVERVLAGYEVVAVTSAVDALRRLEAGEVYDAVVCDLMMPEMTGMELHARVAASQPDVAAKFVFVTGGAFTERAVDFLRETTVPWVEKPFDPATLRGAVERAIAG